MKPDVRTSKGAIGWLTIGAITLFLAILIAAGCKSGRTSQNISLTGGLIGQADVLVEAAIPHTDSTGKPMLATAREKLAGANESNDKASAEFAALDAKYTKLDTKWYVKVGRFIERMIWIITGSWILSGVFSTVACGGLLGVGKWMSVGKFIMGIHHAMPWPNPFDPMADYMQRQAAAKVNAGAGETK